MKKILLLIVLMSNLIYSQDNIKIKTTDIYLVELPTSGEFKNRSILTIWEIDLIMTTESRLHRNYSDFLDNYYFAFPMFERR